VGKFCYDLAEPKRWDVIVFKFPGNAAVNYIKRLIGLPGERVWIVGGNIYTCGKDESPDALRIARKPPQALLQIVDDTPHSQRTDDVGCPSPGPLAGGRKAIDGARVFPRAGRQAWLRWRTSYTRRLAF
jgi:signal peptidase I